MIVVLLLEIMLATTTKSECKATTNIQEFEAQIHRACGQYIQSVSLTGDHESVTYVITYAIDLGGQQIAETVLAQQAWQSAVTSHTVLNRFYPMKRFEYAIKDTKDRDVCNFRFEGDEEKPTKGTCMSYVE